MRRDRAWRHQRLSAIHTDTAHLHLHIAINQVHPESFACIEPWYDKIKLMTACENLEVKHGLQRTSHRNGKQRPSGRAGDLEAHSGEASFLGWIKREVLPSLEDLLTDHGSWQALHAGLAKHGLEIRKRGAGLIIANRKNGLAVKASAIDRRLSFKSLTRQWGDFQSADVYAPSIASSYRAKPLQKTDRAAALYTDYQRRRPSALAARQAAIAQLRGRQAARYEALRAWSRERLDLIRSWCGLTRIGKQDEYAKYQTEKAERLSELHAQSRAEWQAIREAHPAVSWHGFLQSEALAGNEAAQQALSWRKLRFTNAIAIIVPANADWPKDPHVLRLFRPSAHDHGDVYRTGDGGQILDCGRIIFVPQSTDEAILLMLTILAARFPGGTIDLWGSDNFIERTIAIAAKQKPDIRLANPRHEAMRKELAMEILKTKPSPKRPERKIAR